LLFGQRGYFDLDWRDANNLPTPPHYQLQQSTAFFQHSSINSRRPIHKMAVLTATSNPKTILTTTHNTKPILTLLSPALTNSLYLAYILQQLLSTTTLFLLFRTYLLSLFLLQQSYHASQILAIQTLYAASVLGKKALWTSKRGMRLLWRSTERMRKKLFYEFMVFVLGSGGNAAILVVFWPGWIVIGGGIWGIRLICG
jgi:hypothetical protein